MKQKSKDVEFGQCLPLAVLPFVISRTEVKYSANTEFSTCKRQHKGIK